MAQRHEQDCGTGVKVFFLGVRHSRLKRYSVTERTNGSMDCVKYFESPGVMDRYISQLHHDHQDISDLTVPAVRAQIDRDRERLRAERAGSPCIVVAGQSKSEKDLASASRSFWVYHLERIDQAVVLRATNSYFTHEERLPLNSVAARIEQIKKDNPNIVRVGLPLVDVCDSAGTRNAGAVARRHQHRWEGILQSRVLVRASATGGRALFFMTFTQAAVSFAAEFRALHVEPALVDKLEGLPIGGHVELRTWGRHPQGELSPPERGEVLVAVDVLERQVDRLMRNDQMGMAT